MSLAAGLAAAVAVTPGWATATPTVTRVLAAAAASADPATDPVEETPTVDPTATEPDPPTAPPTESAPPETTPPAPDPTTTSAAPPTSDAGNPAPTTTAPTATTAPPPQQGPPPVVSPAAPGPGQPAPSRLGVRVTTGDVTLTDAYWTAASTVTKLRVTIANTGSAPERVRLAYTLPAGLTDAGTEGCASSGGGNYRCGEWTTTPGDRFSTSVRVRVAGTAWRQMPLSGSVRVTATGPGVTGSAQDNEGFAVLFPAGPPVPGIRLQADEVAFDISGGPSQLDVRLGNSGKVDAAGRVEVILPAGVSVPTPPPGCLPVASSRTRCEVGAVPAGRVATLRLPVTATPEAQQAAPLAGAIVGRLDPRSGKTRQLQMSFRITAAAALSTPVAVTPAPTASQGVLAGAGRRDGDGGLSSIQHTAIILMVVSGLLVVLALALATTSLRRRMTGPVADPRTAPAGSE